MAIHDWSHVRAGMFHHFHNSWIYKLSDRLNEGILPKGFYAAGEQVIGDIEPDVLTFRGQAAGVTPWQDSGAIAIEEHPPQVSLTCAAEEPLYVAKQDHIVVRSAEGDHLVAMVEIVSPGNKDSRHRLQQFVDKVTLAIERGCHVLLIDLFPPGGLDPQGMHGAVWTQLVSEEFELLPERPLTFASYRAIPQPVAYVDPATVGDPLPSMRLFLNSDWYVVAPLAESYDDAWHGFPEPWKRAVAGT
jgi:hypothetical protein